MFEYTDCVITKLGGLCSNGRARLPPTYEVRGSNPGPYVGKLGVAY